MKNNTPTGPLFSPEFKEVVKRLKRKEPELDEIVNDGGANGHAEEDSRGTDTEPPC